MNVQTLIDLLAGLNPDAEVRIATQPAWPLQFHLAGVCDQNDVHDATCPDEDQECIDEAIVWLVEGGQHRDNPYAPRAVFDCANDQVH